MKALGVGLLLIGLAAVIAATGLLAATLGRLAFGFGGIISAALAVYAAVLCRRAMIRP